MNREEFIGEKIRQARVIKNISQEELGKIINLPKQIISLIEKGKRKVTASELIDIADYFGKSIDFFYSKEYLTKETDNPRVTYKKIIIDTNEVIETKTLYEDDPSFDKNLDKIIDDIREGSIYSYKMDWSKSGMLPHLEELNYFNVLFLDSVRKGSYKIEEKEKFLKDLIKELKKKEIE